MGVSLEMIRSEVGKIVPNGSNPAVIEIPFADNAKRALELSWDEAQKLGHDYIGTEHLLLGLIRAGAWTVVEKALEKCRCGHYVTLQLHVLALTRRKRHARRRLKTRRKHNIPTVTLTTSTKKPLYDC